MLVPMELILLPTLTSAVCCDILALHALVRPVVMSAPVTANVSVPQDET